MQILNEYTQIACSDGWIFIAVVFAVMLVGSLTAAVCIICNSCQETYVFLGTIMLAGLCLGAICGSLKMANKGEEHYIQCTIDDNYPASELMKYEVIKTEGKIITLKELNYENN